MLTEAIAELKAVAEAELGATVNVYEWWEPNMRLPAVWHWLTDESSSRVKPDGCSVEDTLRITVSIAARPGRSAGADARTLAELGDAYRPALDSALAKHRPGFAGADRARRTGMRFATEKLGDTTALVLELPVELVISEPLTPAT